MSLFSRLVFAQEFVVDEKPQEVFDPAMAGEESALDEDLVHEMSSILTDQERLTQLTERLQSQRAGGTERDTERMMRRFLPRLDGFDRILEGFRSLEPTEEVQNWLRSVETLYYKWLEDLNQLGLKQIECVGKKVDLDYMEVVDYRPTTEYPNNTVIQELKRGYRFNGRVLRDAQVVVANNQGG